MTVNFTILIQQHNKMTHNNKENKYNYLQHSFQKQLQRSYDRNSRGSPPSVNSPTLRSPTNNNNHNLRSAPRSSQFSPYENRQQNVRDKLLVQELKNHNRVLSEQILQYKGMLDKLHAELRLRTEQFASLDMLRQKERLLHEETVCEMKEEINILLTKNTFLEQKNIVLEKQLKKFEYEFTKNQARTRSLSAVAASSKQTSSKLIQQISNLLNQTASKIKKRQTGKLLNQTFSNMNSANLSPKTSSKTSQSAMVQQIQQLVRRVQKYQQLIQSIQQMHSKITGKRLCQDHNQLKMIWKWLKQLGHNYNITQKWKKMLIDVLGLSSRTHSGQELTIDDVLQKTVVELHSK